MNFGKKNKKDLVGINKNDLVRMNRKDLDKFKGGKRRIRSYNEINYYDFLVWLDEKSGIKGFLSLQLLEIKKALYRYCDEQSIQPSLEQVQNFSTGLHYFIKGFIKDELTEKELGKSLELTQKIQRYRQIDFHALFILPKSDNEVLKDFFKNYEDEINLISGNKLDIYYCELDLNKSGYLLIQNLFRFHNLGITMPSLVIWSKRDNKKVIEISLKEIRKTDFLLLLQIVVNFIENNIQLSELSCKIEKSLKEKGFSRPTYIEFENLRFNDSLLIQRTDNLEWKKLILGNKTSECINLMIKKIGKHEGENDIKYIYNFLINISSEYSRMIKDNINGLITNEVKNVRINNINFRLLQLIDKHSGFDENYSSLRNSISVNPFNNFNL